MFACCFTREPRLSPQNINISSPIFGLKTNPAIVTLPSPYLNSPCPASLYAHPADNKKMYVNNAVSEILRPEIVGGHDLTSMRSHFDQNSQNVITASERQIFYFNVSNGELAGKARIDSTKLNQDERIVANDRLANSYYVFTNHGRIFIWNLEAKDWTNELTLPVKDEEVLVSCKMLSKRQYVYSIMDTTSNKVTLNYSMSRSERERPKNRENLGDCSTGELNTFDIGCLVSEAEYDAEPKATQDKLSKLRYLAFLEGSKINIRKLAINEKLSQDSNCIKMNRDFTCIRANPKRSMFAAGDVLGVIYLYSGDPCAKKVNRSKLHWHSLPVSDLCFSSTGNTLFSVGAESGCVVIWDMGRDNIGKKRVVARLGMPIRYINCNNNLNQLILSFEDNEIQIMDTNERTKRLRTFTRRVNEMYRQNDRKALRLDKIDSDKEKSVGLLWHSKTDTVVTNARSGWLQFYSPKRRMSTMSLNFLKSNVLSLEQWARVMPSDITKATLTQAGDWLAFYETRESESSFPEVKLHIWQRSNLNNRWLWIQTADRLHNSATISDLTFSPDGQFLVSVSDDGTFHLLHRVSLDAKSNSKSSSKQMYAVGFGGNVPSELPAKAAFSRDSSVMAMSLKNDTTLIWMILDPYKLVFECQLSLIEQQEGDLVSSTDGETSESQVANHDVLGLHFGHHKSSLSLAPLCEVRTNAIRIWNILNPQEYSEYSIKNEGAGSNEFTAAAFDQQSGDIPVDHFAVSTRNNMIMIFLLELSQNGVPLTPLITVDASPTVSNPNLTTHYTGMCFTGEPILDMDPQCHQDTRVVNLVNRLCLINNHQELVSITDKLTLDRQTANKSCNAIKTFDMTELQAYFTKSASIYSQEVRDSTKPDKLDPALMTEKQRRIRKRLEVQKMLKDLLTRIPSQNLPHMDTLGPMILDKLI